MNYTVRLANQAAIDLEKRIDSPTEIDPLYALALNEQFEGALHRLANFPTGCGLAYETRGIGKRSGIFSSG